MRNELVGVENISKSFGRVQALRNISVSIKEEEIVGLVGDNGAGKSTLAKILCGALKADSGKIYFENEHVEFDSTREAIELGIETVYQDTSLVDQLSIARNMFLGRELTKKIGFIKKLDSNGQKKESKKLLNIVGIKNVDPDASVSTLSGGEKQSIAIARAMYFKAKLLILDEPTNHLGVQETRRVLDFVGKAKEGGTTSIFITHNIHRIYGIADRIVVLGNGRKVGDVRKDETSVDEIVELIVPQ